MRVGILANVTRPGMRQAVDDLLAWGRADGHEILYDEVLAAYGGDRAHLADPARMVEAVDMLLAFGGDGTLLRAARLVGRRGVPILGVNLGGLGFLTEITPAELPDVLPRLSGGDFTREPRALLALNRAGEPPTHFALNDVNVDRGPANRAIEMKLEANAQLVCRYVADGLIVATPTGSTAYALSVGGPVAVPQLRALVVAPVAAHSLAQRPIVFPDDVVLRVTSEEPNVEATVTTDGQRTFGLNYGEACEMRRADFDLHLIRFPERDFYRLVRTKLHWGVDPRHAHRDERLV